MDPCRWTAWRRLPLRLAVWLMVADPVTGSGALAQVPVEVTTVPADPVEGSFVQLIVRAEQSLTVVSGRLGGEPVRFEPGGDGIWRALAAIPLGEHGEVGLALELLGADGVVRGRTVALAVRAGSFPMDQLTVAPRFGTPPDSALAARIAAEQERAMRVSREARNTPRLWSGPFARPRASRVTSGYGGGREFNGQVQSRHLGVDLAGTSGALVRSANRGVVRLVGETYYGGNVVYVDHGVGIVTAYLHLSASLVAEGDTVSTGTPIGRVGATGRVTGPHLHWIARYGTLTVDPLSLERLRLEEFGSPRP